MKNYRLRRASRAALLLAVLGAAAPEALAVTILSGPTLTMDPNGRTPLSGVVELTTDEAVQVELTITDGIDSWSVSFPPALVHYLPVLGMKPNRNYTVDVTLSPGGPGGSVFATTPPLPADFPTLVVTTSNPEAMVPGYTLLDGPIRNNFANDTRPTYAFIVDHAGEVVWYSTLNFTAGFMLENGNLVFRINDDVIEQDMLGNEKPRLVLQDPGLQLHHDFIWTPHGTGLSLSRRTAEVPDYPASYTDPNATAPSSVAYAVAVEFFHDGTVRREWDFIDMIDIKRIGYDALNPTAEGRVWTWSNAINYNAATDTIIVSLRHQDAVVAFSRETGELRWILGNHEGWSPQFHQYLLDPVAAPFRWQYHQHAPMWSDTGTLVLFDNGNWRATPFDGTTPVPDAENFSRGVEYEIDENLMQVRQVWEYGENIDEQIFSRFLSDADSLPGGNRLMTFGGVTFVGGVSTTDLGLGTTHSRVIETTGGENPVKVWELVAYDGTPTAGQIAIYRSDRIPSLYPQQYVKPPNGVGPTLRMDRVEGAPQMSWDVPQVDGTHSAADYYVVYASSSPVDGFAITESTAHIAHSPTDEGTLVCYKIVAANIAGTSGDEPAP